MKSFKDSPFFTDVIKELTYDFGTIYICKSYVVSEINEGVHLTWSHFGKTITDDISCFLGTHGDNVIYISNRINSYSLEASDWRKFYKHYTVKKYCVVKNKNQSMLNSFIEDLFFTGKINRFTNLEKAILFAKENSEEFFEAS